MSFANPKRRISARTNAVFMMAVVGVAISPYASAAVSKQAQTKPDRRAKWQAFWSAFKTALTNDDKTALFALTAHAGFSWEEEPLDLPRDNEGSIQYAIPNQEAFEKNYKRIFTPKIRKRILGSRVIDTEKYGFFIQWEDRKGSYSVSFDPTPEGEFRFVGLNIGPPP